MKSRRKDVPEPFAGSKSGKNEMHAHLLHENCNDNQIVDINNLKMYGYLIIIMAWLIFVISVGTILNLWSWSFNVRPETFQYLESFPWVAAIITQWKEQNKIVDNYYLLAFVLNFVILWIWAVVSWISMKLFRHSKGGGT